MGIFHAFCRIPIYSFKRNKKIGIPPECQIVWTEIRLSVLSCLVWIHAVCKGFRMTTKPNTMSKELITYVKEQYIIYRRLLVMNIDVFTIVGYLA